ncbi:DUF721 domain-containing protein [Thermophagus sp. OGC60D27]|uniref:DUF721 domain-containing protein n=1 Tax=Thermophagus sp. OGC60D27 TaxID=3458415 RepID=UPI00403800E7
MNYKRKNPRKKSIQPLQDILKEIMGQPSISKGIYPSRIPHAWKVAVGPSVVRVTKSIWFKQGVVYVSLNSSIIRNELMMHRDKIIHQMNLHIGQPLIKDLVIR